MSVLMKQHDFERLWRDRETLDPETRARLERELRTNRFARSFTRGGDRVRELLQEMDEVRASDGFSYRMGVYAKNHLEPEHAITARPWFRFSAVSAGLASGAMLMMILLGGPEAMTIPAFNATTGGVDQHAMQQSTTTTPETASQELVTQGDSSTVKVDSSSNRAAHSLPDFNLKRVSTSE